MSSVIASTPAMKNQVTVGQEQTLNILTIDTPNNETEAVISHMRNAGYRINSLRINNQRELNEALLQGKWQLCLVDELQEAFEPAQLLSHIAQSRQPLLCLLLCSDPCSEQTTRLLNEGFFDSLTLKQPERIDLILRRAANFQQLQATNRQQSQQLQELQHRYLDLVNNSRDAIAYLHEGVHILCNPAYAQKFGYSSTDELQNLPLLDMVDSDSQGIIKQLLRSTSHGEAPPEQMHINMRQGNGESIAVDMELSQVEYEGETCIGILIREPLAVAEDQQLLDKLSSLEHHDLLTNLYNRQYFLQQLQQAINHAGPERSHALLYLDLDAFQEIRERHGIGAADHILISIAGLLRKTLGASQHPSRYDGNIFTAIIHDVDEEAAAKYAEALRRRIQEHITEFHGKTLNVSTSIGVAMINNSQPTAEVLLERAHKACALAKANGGNATELFIPLEDELADDEKLSIWRTRIQHALSQNQLRLVYQPIVSLHGKPGEKYDVLMRMLDENNNDVPPGKFLPIAEKLGLAMELDQWVVLQGIKRLQDSGENTILFIKLSSQSVSNLNIIPWLDSQLKKSGVSGDKLVFEVSEAIAFDHLKSMKALCMGLRKLKARIALEHYGMTDNSALVQKHLQAEFIKLDGQMVMQLKDNPEIRDRISQINQTAQQSHSETIAPFVEDANCLAMIWQSGINYIQGYFVQAPDSRMSYDFSESI